MRACARFSLSCWFHDGQVRAPLGCADAMLAFDAYGCVRIPARSRCRRSLADYLGSTPQLCGWSSNSGRPVLVEFWDFCRINSLRTLPYVTAWHERYAEHGPAGDRRPHGRLRLLARAGRDRARGRAARHRASRPDRLGARGLGPVRQPGLARALPVDARPARCSRCTTARAPTPRPSARSASCSASRSSRWHPVRPEDAPDAVLAEQTADQRGLLRRPLRGGRRARGLRRAPAAVGGVAVDGCGVYTRRSSTRTTPRACSTSTWTADVEVLATCFTPGWLLGGLSSRVGAVGEQPLEPRRA